MSQFSPYWHIECADNDGLFVDDKSMEDGSHLGAYVIQRRPFTCWHVFRQARGIEKFLDRLSGLALDKVDFWFYVEFQGVEAQIVFVDDAGHERITHMKVESAEEESNLMSVLQHFVRHLRTPDDLEWAVSR